jgi:hypothetical protein
LDESIKIIASLVGFREVDNHKAISRQYETILFSPFATETVKDRIFFPFRSFVVLLDNKLRGCMQNMVLK